MTFFADKTLEPLKVEKVIEHVFDEESEEFETLVSDGENMLGIKRESNKDEFDKALLELLTDNAKNGATDALKDIVEVIKQVYSEGKRGYVEIGGYIVNPANFSAVKIDGISTRIQKLNY